VVKRVIQGVVLVVGLLVGAPREERPGDGRVPPREECAPGARECEELERRRPETPVARPGQHPCGWVETCQLPCGREGSDCCHAEWDCPPDPHLPPC
jgi:hypothetical protein